MDGASTGVTMERPIIFNYNDVIHLNNAAIKMGTKSQLIWYPI